MYILKYLTLAWMSVFILCACGGGSDSSDEPPPITTITPPSAPLNLSSNTGSTVVSLSWQVPADDGGSAITSYVLQVAPSVDASDIEIQGTKALIENLTNFVTYEFTVIANNAAGASAASTLVTATPKAADSNTYRTLTIANDPGSVSGIYDPSIVQGSNGEHWLAYSSVSFYQDAIGDLVQDVGIRLAQSSDGGDSFSFVATIAEPYAGTVTDSDPSLSACGMSICNGRWVYETAWLVDDISDPDPARRYKLFAHKYFIYPPSMGSKTLYQLGAIVMWTANSPDGTWSTETNLLGWPLTTPDLIPSQDITLLDADTSNCILAAEGSVAVLNNGLNFVFTCPYFDSGSNTIFQKIIMLRSTDNAESFEYIKTLLTPADAPAGVDYFSAPSLIATEDSAPILLVTPVVNGFYAGSMALAFSDDSLSELFRDASNQVQALTYVPVQAAGHIGGASAYARGTGLNGIYQSDATIGANLLDTQFKIIATQSMGDD